MEEKKNELFNVQQYLNLLNASLKAKDDVLRGLLIMADTIREQSNIINIQANKLNELEKDV